MFEDGQSTRYLAKQESDQFPYYVWFLEMAKKMFKENNFLIFDFIIKNIK